MQSLSLSSAQPLLFSLCNKPFPSLQTPTLHQKSHLFHHHSTRIPFHPFGFSVKDQKMLRPRRRFGAACYSAPLTPRNLQWICTVSSAGEYGTWTAFLVLLVRLFFFIPADLELPLVALLLGIVAPYQAVGLRGTQGGNTVSLVIAGYLAYQHFSRAGSLRIAFDQSSIVATLAIICITAVPLLLLI
ncbi:cold-regulated 413 inner membrane protein 1, chloroplastic-like isoform X3 [Malania oleifera]|uniref:cold-regulated 413 inner membrane protein 1, chloroplastic-like isoform X3 n=1 Tax=Malania oleifera TaxID=397392 RepID=UPI0025ADB1E8|nr:cold-regulated 413 inner membrane protein 1, chloroplastic-like isoform X3 [Malania oleifera]